MSEIYNQEYLWLLPLPMSQSQAYWASQKNEIPLQSEKASLPLFLTQSPLEMKAGSSGIKGLL